MKQNRPSAESAAKVERFKAMTYDELLAHCEAVLEAHGAEPRTRPGQRWDGFRAGRTSRRAKRTGRRRAA